MPFTLEDMLGELVIEKLLEPSDQERAIAFKSECIKTGDACSLVSG
jgi:hypothetical protein